MATLHDGTYDAFIIWAEQRVDGVAIGGEERDVSVLRGRPAS